jgi:hypothetical protein
VHVLYTEEADAAMRPFVPNLQKLFTAYSTKSFRLLQWMSFADFVRLLDLVQFLDDDFTREEVKFCFCTSRMLQVNELISPKCHLIDFTSFLEAFARIVEMKTLPDLGLPPELDDRPFAEKVQAL